MGQLQETKQNICFYYKEYDGNDEYNPESIGTEAERVAEIFFEKFQKDWMFTGCNFEGVTNNAYTLEDWQFLSAVEKKIQELLKELNS